MDPPNAIRMSVISKILVIVRSLNETRMLIRKVHVTGFMPSVQTKWYIVKLSEIP